MNFPANLEIRPTDPRLALALFETLEQSTLSDSQFSFFDDQWLIASQDVDIQSYGIAGRIWEASYAMSLYLQSPDAWEFEPQCSISQGGGAIIELGSGTGFLGLRLARLLSQRRASSANASKLLILTDLEEVCPLLQRNAIRAMKGISGVDLRVRALEWGNSEHGCMLASELRAWHSGSLGDTHLSHIICSDLVYFPELLEPLLRTLLQLSSPPFSSVQIIVSYMIRSLTKESSFWTTFGKWFDFTPVLVRRRSTPPTPWERFCSHADDTIFIFVATRKHESLKWPVPNDSGLMKDCDETFETSLLMNIRTD